MQAVTNELVDRNTHCGKAFDERRPYLMSDEIVVCGEAHRVKRVPK